MTEMLNRMLRASLCIGYVAIYCASSVQAIPLLEQLYVQGEFLPGAEDLPGFSTDDDVRFLGARDLRATSNGNFVTVVRTDTSQGTGSGLPGTFYLFGSGTQGTNPIALRREDTLSGVEQQTFVAGSIDLAGDITYTSGLVNSASASSPFASLWENDMLVFQEGDQITAGPLSQLPDDHFFGSASGPYRSPSGVSSWISSYSQSSFGSDIGTALFRDTTNFDVLLQSGDAIASEGNVAAEAGAISGNIRWSDSGTNYLTLVEVETATDTEALPVINGLPVMSGSGAVIREGAGIPVADGGLAGEVLSGFDEYDVNEVGGYVMSASYTSNVPNRNFLIIDGEIAHRQGETLDGVLLDSSPSAVAINDHGDVAFVWSNTLFINGEKIAELGSLVDTDADGVGDAAITNLRADGQLEITNQPAAGAGDLPVVYVGGRIEGNRTVYWRLLPAFADFDSDDDIDGTDFLTWQRGFGIGSTRAEGDANVDSVVDASDLAIWEDSYGRPVPAPLSASSALSVPEPSGCCLSLIALYWLARHRRDR